MMIQGTQRRQEYLFRNGGMDSMKNAGAFFFQAIENAACVPFRIIFGPQVGDGHYLEIGGGVKELLGVAPEDFTERKFNEMAELVIPSVQGMPSDIRSARQLFIQGELKTYKAEILVNTEDGKKKWILDASLPIYDENNGAVIGAFGILYDITDRKNPLISMEKIDECKKLKTAFLRNISHEIRTPLNAIVGFSTLIGEPEMKYEKIQEYQEIISRNSDHLLKIMTDIIEMSRIEAGLENTVSEPLNINKLLTKIYNVTKTEATLKGIALIYASPSLNKDLIIKSDITKIEYVLYSLLDNAIKFTVEGKVEFGLNLYEGNIQFFITDTGVGIPAEEHTSLFSCFYQVESSETRSYGGTGLSLAISKAYARMLGGDIWFTSEKGKGSDFRFSIPCERAVITGPGHENNPDIH